MKLSNFDFVPRTGTHESFMPWREDKVQQLSGNRIKLTAGSSWSAGITMLEPLPLGTLTVEFDCRVMALDPYACFAIWRYHDKSQDEYDDVEYSQWGDANNLFAITTTIWDKGLRYSAEETITRGFRRWRVITTEDGETFKTSVQGWWYFQDKDKQWKWEWKDVHDDWMSKPPDYNPGPLRIALWVPKRGLLYPASASAPLVATINKMEFTPLSSEVAR